MVDYSKPGLNTTRWVAYRHPFTVSPVFLAPSVSYFTWILWCWGPLWPYIRMGSLGIPLHRDCIALGDVAKISPPVSCTCVQNVILNLLIIYIIPSRKISVAIGCPLLIPSFSCLTTSSCLWKYLRAAEDLFRTENLQSNSCQWISHLYKFQDGIQVTQVFRYYGDRQG